MEEASAETVIHNLTQISQAEKKAAEKRSRKVLGAIAVATAILLLACILGYLSFASHDFMRRLFSLACDTGFLNLAALALGFAAWGFAIAGMVSQKGWAGYAIASLLCCALSLQIPTLISFLTIRFEYSATMEDLIGGYYYGSTVLLLGTILLNGCAAFLHKEKEQK